MTMLKKNTYTIDGEELQKRISSEIESLKYNYREWRLAEPGSSDSENCYINYRANVAVLRELFRLQGLDSAEAQMIIDYATDLAEYDTARYQISYLDGEIDDLGTKMYEIVKTLKVEDDGESEKPKYYAVKAQRDELIKRRNVLLYKIAR
nr:MAG TPA: hypothetical protein [Caudoviricetes sp.]